MCELSLIIFLLSGWSTLFKNLETMLSFKSLNLKISVTKQLTVCWEHLVTFQIDGSCRNTCQCPSDRRMEIFIAHTSWCLHFTYRILLVSKILNSFELSLNSTYVLAYIFIPFPLYIENCFSCALYVMLLLIKWIFYFQNFRPICLFLLWVI